ncbi:MAG: ABC transporter permease [Ruminococcus sp.]|nr:ABC transporter permease [Ruminococcus sp.]
MKVFNTFYKILFKNCGVVIMYISIFLFISIANAKSVHTQTEFEDSKPNVLINDLDDTDASKELCSYLESISVVSYDTLTDEEMTDKMYYLQLGYYIEIEKGFEERFASGDTEGIITHKAMDGSMDERLMDSNIDMYLSTAKAYTASGDDALTALKNASKTLDEKAEVTMLNEEVSVGIDSYYRFLPYLLLSAIIMSLCNVIIIMTKKEIKMRTFSSGISPTRFLAEIALGVGTFILVIYLVCCVIIPVFVLGAEVNHDLMIMMLNSLAFTIFTASLVLFISNIVEKPQLISMIGNVIGLGMSFLCGVFVPLEVLSDGIKKVGMFMPAYWYEILNYAVAGNGSEPYSTALMVKCIGIQLAFALAMFLAALAVIKVRQTKKLPGIAKTAAAKG